MNVSIRFCELHRSYIFEVRGPKGQYTFGMRDTLADADLAARAVVRSYKRSR